MPRVCAKVACTSERVSVYSTGSPWGSGVGYRVRERKRGRGGWAWFVFEVESTLHLLPYPLDEVSPARIRHGILKLLKISIHTRRGTRHSRVYVEWVPGYSLIYALIDGMNFVAFKWPWNHHGGGWDKLKIDRWTIVWINGGIYYYFME